MRGKNWETGGWELLGEKESEVRENGETGEGENWCGGCKTCGREKMRKKVREK